MVNLFLKLIFHWSSDNIDFITDFNAHLVSTEWGCSIFISYFSVGTAYVPCFKWKHYHHYHFPCSWDSSVLSIFFTAALFTGFSSNLYCNIYLSCDLWALRSALIRTSDARSGGLPIKMLSLALCCAYSDGRLENGDWDVWILRTSRRPFPTIVRGSCRSY